ncbi:MULTISPECIES: sporulation membrane protein YtaF [Metabacillus]|uniref:Sporulation membrane protein YtaF n=1 Tax=Metabacillus hrfriensis TaxID=3048891 RepID=A0ACD4R9G5_9BACI|nr:MULTISPECIES: sporulation membrane protein YtaF [Metabacillus]UAL51269.1 sporulation membrane protein YtaF [Metabacillus dongyingensis]USK27566.1 sporulation membrane protein YtaF [Bacillus sp. CMF21]WHZ56777.1 sporulation membrane protein YtaF [Metabacillus sp. CT-WN-B3]
MVAAASLFLLAFAVSLDSFSVGFTYGLRKMSMPFKSIVIIACCSAVTLLFAMGAGHLLTSFLPHSLTGKLGGMILIAIGAWVLYQFFRPVKEMTQEESEKTLLNLEIKSFGIVINILSRPTAADIDKSGTITGVEALLLGFALSLDAFGAGIGAALLGYSPILTSLLVAVMSSLFVAFGIKSGHLFSRFAWMDRLTFLPGVLLIILGVWKL